MRKTQPRQKGTGCTQTHHGNFEDGLSEDGNREVGGVEDEANGRDEESLHLEKYLAHGQ